MRYFCLCLGYIISSFGLLMGFVEQDNQAVDLIHLSTESKNGLDEIIARSVRAKSHSSSKESFILYQANLDSISTCPIGVEDRLLLADDGIAFVTIPNGDDFSCKVLKKGGIEISPANGQSFTLSVPPVPLPGPVLGGAFDHAFLAYSIFEKLPVNDCHHRQLCTTWVASVEQLNVENNPFGSLTPNPNADPRLACGLLSAADLNTAMVFDWVLTNDIIYVLVERLPGFETFFGDYAAYVYIIPVAKRNTKNKSPLKDVHHYQICFDSNGTTVTWKLDGDPVFRVTELGRRLTSQSAFVFHKGKPKSLKDPAVFLVADYGGIDRTVVLQGVQSGIGLITQLDYYPAATSLKTTRQERLDSGIYEGLVRMESIFLRPATGDFFYKNPLLGGIATFFQNSVLDPATGQYLPTIPSTFRIFGQGARMRLFQYMVSIEES